MCGKRAAAAEGGGGGGRQREGRWKKRAPSHFLPRTLLQWANGAPEVRETQAGGGGGLGYAGDLLGQFSPPPKKKRELVWVEGRRSRRRRLTRKPRGSRKTPGRMCASCVHSVCIHKCVCAITLDPPAYVCVFYREVFIKGCLAAGM